MCWHITLGRVLGSEQTCWLHERCKIPPLCHCVEALSEARSKHRIAKPVLIDRMAKKKKKKSLKSREVQEEAKEELEVLAAIFGDQFSLDEDERGFGLQLVPHPGRTEPNYVSVQIAVR